MNFYFKWIAIHVTDSSNITIKNSAWGRLSVKTYIMLKSASWISLGVKWLASIWNEMSLKGALEQTLKSPELLKIVINALKLSKLLLKILLR